MGEVEATERRRWKQPTAMLRIGPFRAQMQDAIPSSRHFAFVNATIDLRPSAAGHILTRSAEFLIECDIAFRSSPGR